VAAGKVTGSVHVAGAGRCRVGYDGFSGDAEAVRVSRCHEAFGIEDVDCSLGNGNGLLLGHESGSLD
jgi:hypothetical protein